MRAFHPETVRSILVIRLYFIGDVLLSTPVLEALKRRFPAASLSVLVKRRALDVLLGNPWVDEILLYDEPRRGRFALDMELRSRRFDLAVDLTGDLRSSWLLFVSEPAFRVGFNHARCGFLLDRRIPYRAERHVVDHLLGSVADVGATLESPEPAVFPGEEAASTALCLLDDVGLGDSPYLLLSPGANWSYRRWPSERFGALAERAAERHGLRSIVVGSHNDARLVEELVARSGGSAVGVAGRTSIRELAALASRARAFVGNDSGPMHIAAAAGCPVVALFGPNTPTLFGPRGAPSRVLWPETACSPCDQKRCVRPLDPCMQSISVEDVADALSALLEETEGR